jgi:hypothetical protein
MKTQLEWVQDIIKISNKIHKEFPELTKFITEMPVNNSGKQEISIENLEGYYYSL